jgi:hypothetical protein
MGAYWPALIPFGRAFHRGGRNTVIFAGFFPHLMHSKRGTALASCTDPKPLNAALALTVQPLRQFVQWTLSGGLISTCVCSRGLARFLVAPRMSGRPCRRPAD